MIGLSGSVVGRSTLAAEPIVSVIVWREPTGSAAADTKIPRDRRTESINSRAS